MDPAHFLSDLFCNLKLYFSHELAQGHTKHVLF